MMQIKNKQGQIVHVAKTKAEGREIIDIVRGRDGEEIAALDFETTALYASEGQVRLTCIAMSAHGSVHRCCPDILQGCAVR